MTRPLITFALLTYNQERYVAQALRSALAQIYQPLEVLIVDDLSSDSTVAIVEKIIAEYGGPHRVRLHRNTENLNCTANTVSAIAMAEGDLVVCGAGDDISEPERVEMIFQAQQRAGEGAYSFWSAALLVDENGDEIGVYSAEDKPPTTAKAMAELAWTPCGATLACRKAVVEVFGPVDARAALEDLVLHFRAALLGQVVQLSEKLVQWRRHATSMDSAAVMFRSLDSATYAQATRRGVEQRYFCFQQRGRDLDTARRLWPQRSAELAGLVDANNRHILDYESLRLMGEQGWAKPFRGIVMAWHARHSIKEITKRFLMLHTPRLWLSLMRLRADRS